MIPEERLCAQAEYAALWRQPQAVKSVLRLKMPALLSKLRLGCGEIQVEGTPRRLAVMVSDLALQQRASQDKLRGPPAKVSCQPDPTLCCAVLCCAVLCCAVLFRAVLCCTMLCPAVHLLLVHTGSSVLC